MRIYTLAKRFFPSDESKIELLSNATEYVIRLVQGRNNTRYARQMAQLTCNREWLHKNESRRKSISLSEKTETNVNSIKQSA